MEREIECNRDKKKNKYTFSLLSLLTVINILIP